MSGRFPGTAHGRSGAALAESDKCPAERRLPASGGAYFFMRRTGPHASKIKEGAGATAADNRRWLFHRRARSCLPFARPASGLTARRNSGCRSPRRPGRYRARRKKIQHPAPSHTTHRLPRRPPPRTVPLPALCFRCRRRA